MGLLDPVRPPYDPLEWAKKPFPEKSRMVCRHWALNGYGAPLGVYLIYVIKVFFYIGAWMFFCSFTPGMGNPRSIGSWWLEPVAFQKAILWSMLFEGMGLGCGSGPLTGRYIPPFGGILYFLRAGTTKLPPFPRLPVLGGSRRTWLDVGLYAAIVVLTVRVLTSADIGLALLIPIAVLVAVLGVADKTTFLCFRAEHYWTTVMVFVLASSPSGWIPGAKAVMGALWFWAGVSKLNHHFPNVVCVMTSNSPFTRFGWLRKRMYRNFPDDLSPSRVAVIAHAGTVTEFAVPAVLLAGHGGALTAAGIGLMLFLHLFITANMPMGVPLEWNVMMVYGGFFLFWKHADASVFSMPLAVGIFLIVMLVIVPLAGNLFPSRIPFLLAMRFYAGNWAYSIWLFKGDSHRKLDRLTKASPWIYDQVERIYDKRTSVGILGTVIAFRLMHLHGRALPMLLPKAVDRPEDYEWLDGETVAGMVIGWDFGDGHLHREDLLRSVQEQCGFEEGELRCIFVESQPLGRSTLHYRIHDAKTGLIEEGHVDVKDLRKRQPWADAAQVAA